MFNKLKVMVGQYSKFSIEICGTIIKENDNSYIISSPEKKQYLVIRKSWVKNIELEKNQIFVCKICNFKTNNYTMTCPSCKRRNKMKSIKNSKELEREM